MASRSFCPACGNPVDQFLPGPGGRPQARCPRCQGLERHRFFALLLGSMAPRLQDLDTVVEIAPSPPTTRALSSLPAKRHLRFDIGYDNRAVDALASLTELPLPAGSVDLLVCYHVLEHVPDDLAAIREIARVLRPDGLALVQVPLRLGTSTDEDPSVVDEEERVRRFGQADHVRYYGDDFEDRLTAAGLRFDRATPMALLGERAVDRFRLSPHEFVWVVSHGERPRGALSVDWHATPLTRTLDHVLADNDRLLRRLERAQQRVAARTEQVDRLKGRVTRLRERVERLRRRLEVSEGARSGWRTTASRAATRVRSRIAR